jgi:arylsulfatase A-like enzyme
LDWLDRQRDPRRSFFAFLNFNDAHEPYKLADGARHRFGRKPETADELRIIELWSYFDKLTLPAQYLALARDSYDNCLAYLDDELGALVDELDRRGQLDDTWIVILGDHGEGLGEHDLFEHGQSLYSTEIRVPLLIVPPSGRQSGAAVREIVSLRDLPATIADFVGLGTGAPFPGRSLASLWRDRSPGAAADVRDGALSELVSRLPHSAGTDHFAGRRRFRLHPQRE